RRVETDAGDTAALTHDPRQPRDVAPQLGRHGPPGVAVVERGGGVEDVADAGAVARRRRPAVPEELVDAAEHVLVHLADDVERRGAERWRVVPCPGLGGDDARADEAGARGGPAALCEVPPSP